MDMKEYFNSYIEKRTLNHNESHFTAITLREV